MQHKLVSKNGHYHLCGEMLLIRYKAGDIDFAGPKTSKKNLHRALYDFYQCSDVMKDGDEILNSRGRVIARCVSFHVVMED